MIPVRTYLTPYQVDELALRGKTVAVIDVLRASTTVIAALSNGAREVIPTPTVEAAAKIAGHLAGDVTIRGGERNGKIIEGFSLGNSPLEYSGERVRDKSIVYTTTNGSSLILRAKYALHTLVCGFVNINAVAAFVKANASEVEILCAGNAGGFALEDAVCAGMLVHLLNEGDDEPLPMSDATLAAHSLYRGYYKNILRMLRQCEHGKFLDGLGFADDLVYCAGVDTVPVLPFLDDNILRLRKVNGHRESVAAPATV
jgi:2-phosphosulfolactate phosphatase